MPGTLRTVPPPRAPVPLRVLRLQLGLTQAQLAVQLGLETSTVHRWEHRGHAGRHERLVRLALAGLRGELWRSALGRVAWLTQRTAEEREGRTVRLHRGFAAEPPRAVQPKEI